MPSLFAREALLASGWARDVLLEWDDGGTLTRVEPASPAGAGANASGPVVPGMTNVHSHAFQRAMAGLAEFRAHPTDDFWTWREEMYRLVSLVEPDDVQAIARHLYVEMLTQGYTCVAEFHYLHNDRDGARYSDRAEMAHRIVESARETGIALTFTPVLYAHGGFGHKPLAGAQRRFASDPEFIAELLRSVADFYSPDPLLRLAAAPHSVRAIDAFLLTELVQRAAAIDPAMRLHMHLSEQAKEVSECLETHGATPLDWLSDLVPLDERWCFIHATHLTKIEQRRLASSGASVGLCPTTEANLGDGIFEFAPWFEAGAPWAIGGDSHVSVSPFEELRALESSQRLRHRARNVIADEEFPDVAANLWSGAALGGARAAAQPAGEIAVGCRADLVVLDARSPQCEGLSAAAILAVATFAGNSNPVRDVFVGGRHVIADGRHASQTVATEAYRASLRRLRASR